MASNFAALETRLNTAVLSRLSNDTATINSALVTAIFDTASVLAAVGAYGMASTQPTLTVATADVPANPVGRPAVVNAIRYRIAEHEPDGTGISRLLLEREI